MAISYRLSRRLRRSGHPAVTYPIIVPVRLIRVRPAQEYGDYRVTMPWAAKLPPAALAAVWIAVAALPPSPIGHDLALPSEVRDPFAFLERSELLGVSPILLGKHAVAESGRTKSVSKAFTGAGVIALFRGRALRARFASQAHA